MRLLLISIVFVLMGFIKNGYTQGVSEETFSKALKLTEGSYESISRVEDNTFLATYKLEGEHLTRDGYTTTFTIPILYQNHGEHYTMLIQLPVVISGLYEQLTTEEGSFNKSLNKTFRKAAEVSHSRSDNDNPLVYVKVNYGRKKPLGIMLNIVDYLNNIIKPYQKLAMDHKRMYKKTIKEFENEKLTSIDNEWLPYLVGDESFLEHVYEPDIEGAIGHWSFSNTNLELECDFYNYKDRFEIYITGYVGDAEEAQNFLPSFEEFVQKKKYKKASSTEASIRPSDDENVGVKITFKYDGVISGKDFVKAFKEYYNYGKQINKVY